MRILAFLLGLFFCLGVVLDAFQTIILPRRPSGRLRITRIFYLLTWTPWVALANTVSNRKTREQIYSIFGPISLLMLLGLWALLLVSGFGLVYFGLGSPFVDPKAGQHFLTDLYVSGTTLFTLGIGDVTPTGYAARILLVLEAGTGLGFVALVIGYVPVLYQAFSRREISVAMLDGRAGSPPTATELLRRHAHKGGDVELIALLAEWERWSAEILESHISYPLLCYYRSQHDNQSWLSALVSVLDTCALLITTVRGPQARQAQLTFAMARHALIDLGHVFHVEEKAEFRTAQGLDRLPPDVFSKLCLNLGGQHLQLCVDPESVSRLAAIRLLYEPQAHALSEYLKMALPLWVPEPRTSDPWKTVADLLPSSNATNQIVAANLHDEEHGF